VRTWIRLPSQEGVHACPVRPCTAPACPQAMNLPIKSRWRVPAERETTVDSRGSQGRSLKSDGDSEILPEAAVRTARTALGSCATSLLPRCTRL
jgi:hypothetical protein